MGRDVFKLAAGGLQYKPELVAAGITSFAAGVCDCCSRLCMASVVSKHSALAELAAFARDGFPCPLCDIPWCLVAAGWQCPISTGQTACEGHIA